MSTTRPAGRIIIGTGETRLASAALLDALRPRVLLQGPLWRTPRLRRPSRAALPDRPRRHARRLALAHQSGLVGRLCRAPVLSAGVLVPRGRAPLRVPARVGSRGRLSAHARSDVSP